MLAEGLPYLESAPWIAGAPMDGLLLLGLVAGPPPHLGDAPDG